MNKNGNYIYKVGETEYVLNPVMKYSATLGVTIHDLSGNDITLDYTGAGTTVEKEDNCYKNRTHTFKIVGNGHRSWYRLWQHPSVLRS